MSNDKKTTGKAPRPVVLPDGTVFTAYGVVTRASPPITPTSGRGTSPGERRKPATTPDWSEWRYIPKVEVWQACALSLNLDPHSLEKRRYERMSESSPVPYFEDSSFPSKTIRDEFNKRRRMLIANLPNNPAFSFRNILANGCSNVALAEFTTWALSIGWNIPPELAAMAQKPGAPSVAPIPQQSNGHEAVMQPVDSESTNPRTRESIGSEPLMKAGRNSADSVVKWVKYQARELVKENDRGKDLAERIRLLAEKNKYESERGKLSIHRIVKLLPAGITGGREKNTGRPKNN